MVSIVIESVAVLRCPLPAESSLPPLTAELLSVCPGAPFGVSVLQIRWTASLDNVRVNMAYFSLSESR